MTETLKKIKGVLSVFIFNHAPRAITNEVKRIQRCVMCFHGSNVTTLDRARVTSWSPPPVNWVKVNCTGVATFASGKAACGGIIRSYDGSMVTSYARNLGPCSIVLAELWGIYHGLALAKNQGMRHVIIESDALRAINMIQGYVSPWSTYYQIVRQIFELSCVIDEVKWIHVAHEANQVADSLAKHGLSLDSDQLNVFHVVPDFLADSLKGDLPKSFYSLF